MLNIEKRGARKRAPAFSRIRNYICTARYVYSERTIAGGLSTQERRGGETREGNAKYFLYLENEERHAVYLDLLYARGC